MESMTKMLRELKVKKTRIYFKNLKDRYKALEDER